MCRGGGDGGESGGRVQKFIYCTNFDQPKWDYLSREILCHLCGMCSHAIMDDHAPGAAKVERLHL